MVHHSIFPVLGVLLSLSVLGQTMKTKTSPGVDLTRYETFTVMKGEFMTPPDQQKISEQELFRSMQAAVRKEMEPRGYRYVEDSSAQLYVSYVAGAYDLTQGGNLGPLSQSPASNPSEMNQSRSWSRETREGMLVIDIRDAHGSREIWSATGNLALDGVELSRALDAAVYRSFRKFPNRNKIKKKKK